MEYVKFILLILISLFLIEYKFNVNFTASLERKQISAVVKLYKLKIVTILFLKTLKIRILNLRFRDITHFKSAKNDKKEKELKKVNKTNKNKTKDNTKIDKLLKILPEIKINKISQLGSIGFNDAMVSGFSCGGFMGVLTFIDCIADGKSVFIPAWEDEFSLISEMQIGVTPINVIAGLIA